MKKIVDKLNEKSKTYAQKKSKANKKITCQQVKSSHFVRSRDSVYVVGFFGRQKFQLTHDPPPVSFLLALYVSMTQYGMKCPFGPLGSTVLAVSPPNLQLTLSLQCFLKGGLEKQL